MSDKLRIKFADATFDDFVEVRSDAGAIYDGTTTVDVPPGGVVELQRPPLF